MKGQIFILIAFMIAVMISMLGNIYTYSSLPGQTIQLKTSDTLDVLRNVQNELTYVIGISGSTVQTFSDFILFVNSSSRQKGYNVTYTTGSSP
jgi:uncharacterized membrane protein YjdF